MVLLLAGCRQSQSEGSRQDLATVTNVIDGDTIELRINQTEVRVRLLGIDAPESVHPHLPVQCYGPEASTALAELLPVGTAVYIRRDVEVKDHFDRLLLYVYRAEDDLFVNRWLVDQGLADESHYEPNSAKRQELVRAKSSARANSIGLWGNCQGPDQPLE